MNQNLITNLILELKQLNTELNKDLETKKEQLINHIQKSTYKDILNLNYATIYREIQELSNQINITTQKLNLIINLNRWKPVLFLPK